jgi:hypothetical protein
VWPEVCTDDDAYAAIVRGLDEWIASGKWAEEDGRYIPSALTFLEGRYWEKPPQVSGGQKVGTFDPDRYRKWRNAQ